MPTPLEETLWDLEPLVDGRGAGGVRALLGEAQTRADELARRCEGRVGELEAPGLAAAVDELGAIRELEERAGSYAALHFSVDTTDPARGALLQSVQEAATALQSRLLFFELEWTAVEDGRAEQLLGAPELGRHGHHLRAARRYRPHLLSAPEERILAEKELTSWSAWTRLFTEQASEIEVDLPAEARAPSGDAGADSPDAGAGSGDAGRVPLEAALSLLQSERRQVREASARAISGALGSGLRVRTYVFNTLMADKATTDRLRRYPHWLSSRNLSNEAADESVQALLDAVRSRYDLPQRWYRLKAGLLGLDRLADYDRSAPVGGDAEADIPWEQATALVRTAYRDFSPRLGDIVDGFLGGPYIDAPMRPGKRGGAFCAYTVPSAHPYILLNYAGTRRDVLTLAHELGHGVHAALAAPQGIFHFSTPLTVAEMASTLGEQLVFERLLGAATEPGSRLGLLGHAIDDSIATVFRQVAMNRFEDVCHTRRRGEGELSAQTLGEIWMQTQAEMLGDSVELTGGYADWHSYIPHFISTPGYVYAYAYGQLLALSIYQSYKGGDVFVPAIIDMLAAGGSRSPEELAGMVGIDLSDPGFWGRGLKLIDDQLDAAERAAGPVQA